MHAKSRVDRYLPRSAIDAMVGVAVFNLPVLNPQSAAGYTVENRKGCAVIYPKAWYHPDGAPKPGRGRPPRAS
jgi:hypothetical protein